MSDLDISWEPFLLNRARTVDRSSTSEEREATEREFRLALDRVCAGCEREWLVGHFAMRLMPDFMPADNWETLVWEGASIRALKRIEKRAEDLLGDIRNLRRTLWIRNLTENRLIRPGDLLHRSTTLDCFDGILRLSRRAAKAKPAKRKTDENDLLTQIVLHVHKHTGKWRDADIGSLNYLLGLPQPTADAMKTWRSTRAKKDPRLRSPRK